MRFKRVDSGPGIRFDFLAGETARSSTRNPCLKNRESNREIPRQTVTVAAVGSEPPFAGLLHGKFSQSDHFPCGACS